jgi:uncharacterized protein (TIGR02421 family)
MKDQVREFSLRLKDIARDLAFLGSPRYPLDELRLLFPQHRDFVAHLEDVSVPFAVDAGDKERAMDRFLRELADADVTAPLKQVFARRIEDYRVILTMLGSFGTRRFYEQCRGLYGSSRTSTRDDALLSFIEEIPKFCRPDRSEHRLRGEAALAYLRDRLRETFDEREFEVRPSSSLLSDSSAGRRVLKLNPHKDYTTGQLDVFLVHEGWVHLGTSINGAHQEANPWLGTWAPRTTLLQEGLAVTTELVTGVMTLERWNRIVLRHLAASMAERGSSVTEVYEYLRHHDVEELDAFKLSLRVFRGVPLEGGMAFTKELLYLHGMIELLSHLRFYRPELRSFWVGKISFDEHLALRDRGALLGAPVKYYPRELEVPEACRRLATLAELAFGLFSHGYR